MAKESFNGLTVDNQFFNVIIYDYTESTPKLADPNSGRTLDGVMHISYIGTYLNVTFKIRPKAGDIAEFDRACEYLRRPNPSFRVKIPYNQGTKIITGYINVGDRILRRIDIDSGEIYWDSVSVSVISNAKYM